MLETVESIQRSFLWVSNPEALGDPVFMKGAGTQVEKTSRFL